jgi:hypothetical protein
MPKNCYFLGSEEVSDNFSEGLINVAGLYCLKKPRARGIETLEKEMLTLQLFTE